MRISVGILFLVFAIFLASFEILSALPPKTEDSLENVGQMSENANRQVLPPKKRRYLENDGTTSGHANHQESNAMHRRSVSPPRGFERVQRNLRLGHLMNAMHRKSGVSAPPKGLAPLQINRDLGRPTRSVYFGYIKIDVWLDEHSRVQQAYMENGYRILPEYYEDNNFLIRTAICGGIMLIAYVDVSGILLGIRPPHLAGESGLTPTPTEWYIHYSQRDFRLTVDPEKKTVTHLRLYGTNYGDGGGASIEEATVAAIEIEVWRDRNKKITDCDLIRPYVYRLG